MVESRGVWGCGKNMGRVFSQGTSCETQKVLMGTSESLGGEKRPYDTGTTPRRLRRRPVRIRPGGIGGVVHSNDVLSG